MPTNTINKCRVCGNDFYKTPLLHYKNMPKSAQFFPSQKEVKTEKGIPLSIYQCSGCGLIQLNSMPVSYYKNVIRASAVSQQITEFRHEQFSNFVKKHSLQNKKILEVGCGKGEHLAIMQQYVKKSFGIENFKESVDYCKKNGLNVEKNFLDKKNQRLKNAPFDAFFILNFLEHLPDINNTLRAIANNLTDDGIGLIEVPNFDMMLRNNLFFEFIPDHLFYFTKDTLNRTLSYNGFEVIDCKVERFEYLISATVRKRKKLQLDRFKTYQDKLTQNLNKLISSFHNQKIAIWGASHQALAVIAMTNIKNKISYVIDSAPFKQNKFTPATHLPIYSPEILKTQTPHAIIVMAASYSEEVAAIIKKHNPLIRTFILKEYELIPYL